MLPGKNCIAILSLLVTAPLAHADRGAILHCEPTVMDQFPNDAHVQVSGSAEGLILSVTSNMYGLLDTETFRAVENQQTGKSVYTATAMLNARPGANPGWVRSSVATLRLTVAGGRGSLDFYDADSAVMGLKMSCAAGAEPNPNYQPGAR